MPDPVSPPIPPIISGAISAVQGVGSAVQGTVGAVSAGVNFASDPIGSIADGLRLANLWIVKTAIPEILKATKPQFDREWFITYYGAAFGIGFMIAMLYIMMNFVHLARGKVSSRVVTEKLFSSLPTYLLACMFGPAAAMAFFNFVFELSDTFLNFFLKTSIESTMNKLAAMMESPVMNIIPGAPFIKLFCYLPLSFALLILICAFLALVVGQCFAGVIYPVVSSRNVSAMKQSRSYIGLRGVAMSALSVPAILFLLAFAYALIGNFPSLDDKNAVGVVVGLWASALVIIMTAVSPFWLFKVAPVLDGNHASAPRLDPPPVHGSGLQSLTALAARSNSAPSTEPAPSSGGSNSWIGQARAAEAAKAGSGTHAAAQQGTPEQRTPASAAQKSPINSGAATQGAQASGSTSGAAQAAGGAAKAGLSGVAGALLPVAAVGAAAASGARHASDKTQQLGDFAAAYTEPPASDAPAQSAVHDHTKGQSS